VSEARVQEFDAHGARLQVKMFDRAELPDPARVEDFAERAAKLFAIHA
jgi:hypothetical protein